MNEIAQEIRVTKLFEETKKRAESGDRLAMRELARIYLQMGTMAEMNAFFWFRRAALLGDISSVRYLIICYYYGIGCYRDPASAAVLQNTLDKELQ
jgi:TPR repeat protein